MRYFIIIALAILAPGCFGTYDDSGWGHRSDEPSLWLEATPTAGLSPLAVLVEFGMKNPPRGENRYNVHIMDEEARYYGSVHSTGSDWNDSVTFIGHTPGIFVIRLDVEHGESHWFNETTITVLDSSMPPLLVLSANVTETCRPCSRYPALPIDERLGASGCLGLHRDEEGRDCTWSELNESVWERPFAADSTGGDVDLEFRTSCTTDPTTSIQQYRQYNGAEEGEVPPDAGCVILWEDNSAPSQIRFIVCDANIDSFWDERLEEAVYMC